ncbi:MAG: 50S ribosomal protein L17 [bacterium]|nr:50S ribosomal protein L17 [bacterium]
MRHLKKGKTLDRKRGPRLALLRGLANNFILYEKIKTTQARAKVLRSLVERLISLSKNPTLAHRRLLIKSLYTEGAVKKALEVLGPRYKERAGGYTRIIKLKQRQGDGAPIVLLELV